MGRCANTSTTDRQEALGPARILLCLIAGLTPIAFAAPLPEPYIAPKEILVQAGTAVLLIACLFSMRPGSVTLTPVWIPALALAGLGLASAAWSSNPEVSLDSAFRMVSYPLLFGLALELLRKQDARSALASVLVFAGVIEAVYVLAQYFAGDPLFATEDLKGKWQTFGTLGNPNWTGEFLAVAALVGLGRMADLTERNPDERWRFVTRFVAFALILAALAATIARGAWIAFVAGTAAFLFVRRREIAASLRPRSLITISVACISAVALVVIPLISRKETAGYLLNTASIRGRVWIWSVTGSMIYDAPLLGHGLGTFGLQFPHYQADAYAETWSVPFTNNASFASLAHNDYLQIWSELGLPGLAAVAGFVILTLSRGRKLRGDPVSLGCWAALVSILVSAAFGFPTHLPTSLMLLAVLTAVVEASVNKRRIGLPKGLPMRSLVLIPVLIAGLISGGNAYSRLSTETALRRAESATRNSELQAAESSIRDAIRHTPTSNRAYKLLGMLAQERGNGQLSVAAYDRALVYGFDVDVFLMKASSLEKLGRRLEAAETLRELIRLRPDLASPRSKLALLEGGPEISRGGKEE